MIKVLFFSAVLLCCLLMFTLRREYKVGLLFLGTMIFTPVYIPFLPFRSANAILIVVFLISEFRNIKIYIRTLKTTLLWRLMGIVLFLTILTIYNSPHLSSVVELRSFLQSELLFKYFAICYAFLICRNVLNVSKFIKISQIGIIILTLFGIVNLVSMRSDVLSILMEGMTAGVVAEGEDIGEKFVELDRFRVQALFANPFDYGYICVLTFLFHLYAFTCKMETKKVFLLVTSCCLFGIILCGCRTLSFVFVISFIVFCLFAYKLKKFIGLSMIGVILLLISIPYIPALEEKVNYMFSVFDKNSQVGGSSLEMRSIQYAAVLSHVANNPVLGCGYNYFHKDFGWGEGKKYLKDDRLFGLEGVHLNYILERGFLGFALYLLFYIIILSYLWKLRRVNKNVSGLGLSILVAYLSFSFMTGELKSVYLPLLIMGLAIGIMETKKSQLIPPIEWIISVINQVFASFSCKTIKLARVCC